MVLQQDTISIDLAQGVNNKVDDKIAGPEQTSKVIDARFDKDKRLVKRNGLTAQSLNFQGDPGFINSISFSSGNLKSFDFVHSNQLCLENNGSLFAQYSGQDKWIFKGTYVPVEINLSRLNANIAFTDTVTVGSVTITSGDKYVYVTEEATGNIINKTELSGGEKTVRLIGFNSSAYVLSGNGNSLLARPVSLQTGIVGSSVLLSNEYLSFIYPPNLTVTSSASVIGEAAFIAYSSISPGMKIAPFLSIGSISSLGILNISSLSASAFASAITMEPSVNPNRFYVADLARISSITINSGNSFSYNYFSVYTPSGGSGSYVNQVHTITMSLSPINNQDLYLYTDYTPTQPNGSVGSFSFYSDDYTVTMIRINSGGGIISNNVYGVGYALCGQSFRDNARKTIYLPSVYVSPLQTTVFYMDTLEGRADRTTYVMGKTLYGDAAPFIQSSAAGSYSLSQCLPIAPGGDIFRLVNNGYFVDYNLTPDNAPQTQFLANTSHLTGGLLWAYDGNTLSEHNFLIFPEQLEAQSASANSFGVTTITQGDGSHAEKFTFTCPLGCLVNPGESSTNWLGINGNIANYYIWFRVDGVGVDPAPSARTGVVVDVSATDTAQQVASALFEAARSSDISNDYFFQFPFPLTIPDSTSVLFTSNSFGALGDASVNGFSQRGNMSLGSYQFCTVFSWTDRNGQIYRSAPSVPVTLPNVVGSSSVGLLIWTPQITNKKISDINIEIYQTTANGTTFHFCSSVTMVSGITRRIFVSTFSDSVISERALLYTDGGILDNYNIGSVKSVSFFKERLQVAGVDDKYAIYYSKSVVPGEPVNFTAETFYRLDADLTPVTSIIQMDDKSIVFKPNLVYAISGDGANDLGEGSTLSPPLLVASDAGTSIPNSVVLYPNGLLFKSAKGIYSLDRKLGVGYIGAPVEDFNGFQTSAAVLMKNETEIRFTHTDTSTALIYNYYFNRWDYFSNYQCDAATIYNGNMVVVRNSGKVMIENSLNYDIDNGSQSYSIYLETVWLKLKGIQDFQRIYQIDFLGEYLTPHQVNVNVSYDYNNVASDSNDYGFNATQIIGQPPYSSPGSSVYQFQFNVIRQKCQSIKIKFTETPDSMTAGSQSSLYLNNLSAIVGLKMGLNKLPPEKQS